MVLNVPWDYSSLQNRIAHIARLFGNKEDSADNAFHKSLLIVLAYIHVHVCDFSGNCTPLAICSLTLY